MQYRVGKLRLLPMRVYARLGAWPWSWKDLPGKRDGIYAILNTRYTISVLLWTVALLETDSGSSDSYLGCASSHGASVAFDLPVRR